MRTRLDNAFSSGPTAQAHVEEAPKGEPQQRGKHRPPDTNHIANHRRDSSIRARGAPNPDTCAMSIPPPNAESSSVVILCHHQENESSLWVTGYSFVYCSPPWHFPSGLPGPCPAAWHYRSKSWARTERP